MRLFESSFSYIYRYFALHLKSKMPVLECMIVTQVKQNIFFASFENYVLRHVNY